MVESNRSVPAAGTESVEELRVRARAWAAEHLKRRRGEPAGFGRERVEGAQRLQQALFDAGLAGITWPPEYGGRGLTVAHMKALDEELNGYETPYRELSVSVGIVGPTILELGTDEQKARYLPRLLRGDDLWVQYLSEPTGGSDMAAVATRATRDGDSWVLNGSKVWTTFGHYADYALCLARSDWSKPKHRGLSMFIVKVDSPGLSVVPLKQATGEAEFCQEFLDDVIVSADALLGAENDGWTVASRLLMHERNALGGGSVYFSLGETAGSNADVGRALAAEAAATGSWDDPVLRDEIAGVHIDALVAGHLSERVKRGVALGRYQGPVGSVLKLFSATAHLRLTEVALAVRGEAGAAWLAEDPTSRAAAMAFIGRQGGSLAGGSDEIQRNIVSERVLGLPREPAPDKDLPFDQVRQNRRPVRP
jgi:alkylation response protein AidB-like acyl-CoA dehydrogenase